MSGGGSTPRALAALLALVEADRERRCRALLEPAEAAARATFMRQAHALRRAHREALARQDVERGVRLARARARVAAAEHARALRRAAMIADEAWPLLQAALLDRWRQPQSRQRWISSVLAVALARLPARDWLVRHPLDLPQAERESMRADLARGGIAELRCEAVESIDAGIEIRAGEARLDATVAGLTRDRQAVLGRLLHLWASA